jgi:hypothetical protein
MVYYIIYPENIEDKVKITTEKPQKLKGDGFCEGSFKTKRSVIIRLNWMDIPQNKRPKGFSEYFL